MCHYQDAGQRHKMRKDNSKNVPKFKYLSTTVTNQNNIHITMHKILNLRHSIYTLQIPVPYLKAERLKCIFCSYGYGTWSLNQW